MNALRKMIDKIKPTFSEGGKLSMFRSVFDGFETFLFVPNTTSKSGAHIHDAIDSKRIMIMVVIALMPALLFGMYNVGYQHYLAIGQLAETGFWTIFAYGLLAVLPKIVVSYLVGLGIEFTVAQFKGEEIHEGFLVSGIIIPMIVPVDCPLWMLALATAFSVIFAKEIFGGTGMNIFNVAIVTRMFLFFSYPSKMSGDSVWIAKDGILGLGEGTVVDTFTGATPLGQVAVSPTTQTALTNAVGEPSTIMDAIIGLIPGSIGETSIASWKIMLSIFGSGALMAWIFNAVGPDTAAAALPWYEHLILGGFAFGAVFMATDPVTSARTEAGKWMYGCLIGALAIIIRVLNPGYPEGMMLAILFGNVFAPLFDYLVVQRNISKRAKRAAKAINS